MDTTQLKRAAATHPRHWCELGPDIPMGLFMASKPSGARFWIFPHVVYGYRYSIAVQLDQCEQRPAFSYIALTEPTGIVGIWLGEAVIERGPFSDKTVFPHRSGVLKQTDNGLFVRCTGGGGSLILLRVDGHEQYADEQVWANYEKFSLQVELDRGRFSAMYQASSEPILRHGYVPLPGTKSLNFSRVEQLYSRTE